MRGAPLLWLWAIGCFDPKFNNPACGPAGECPPGLVCVAGTCTSVDIDAPLDDTSIDMMIDTPPGAVTREDRAKTATSRFARS